MVLMADNTEKLAKDKVFEEEFLPQIDALYNFAYHLTYSEEDANDLVQEAYMKAYRFINNYEVGTNAKAWLFRILKNAFINDYRKKNKQPTKVDYEEIVNFHNEEDTNFSSYDDLRTEMFDKMMGDEVTTAINSLPVDFRTVILLCDIEGFTYEEISKIINVPIGTVRSRLHRSRNMLKEKLREYAAEYGYSDKRSKE
ncbi:MAG: sigma-70 family RNA polymerase sigma factor [Saprospiraceae bacterium]